jgi:hypothetical protein
MVVDYFLDFEGDVTNNNVAKAIDDLSKTTLKVTINATPEVPWFPTTIDHFNHIGNKILSSGDGI